MNTKILVEKHFETVKRLGVSLKHPNFKTVEEYKDYCIRYLEELRKNEKKNLWISMVSGSDLSEKEIEELQRFFDEINLCFSIFPSTLDQDQDELLKNCILLYLLN